MNNVNLRAIAFGILSVIALWALLSFFFTIDAGERGVVLRFGAVTRVVAEGIRMKAIETGDGKLPNVTGGAVPFISVGEGKHR
jgi:hypothetical protein